MLNIGSGVLVPAKPAWVPQSAIVDMDFARGRYFGGNPAEVFTLTRATVGYAVDSANLLRTFASGELRRTDLGLLLEDTRTNVCLWNRDLTNVVWVLGATMTVALDQVGLDGVTNSASSITGGASSATNTILQVITLGSSARWQTAYVKRITGSGTVNMTMDNGVTWTAITVTDTVNWSRVAIPTQTLANPTVGFQIVTSGDAIAVDLVQNENNGSTASSPIITTTVAVARNVDSVVLKGRMGTIIGLGGENTAGTVLFQLNNLQTATGPSFCRRAGATTEIFIKFLSATTFAVRASNTQQSTATIGSGSFGAAVNSRVVVGWDSAGVSYAGNGGAVIASATAFAAGASPDLGATGSMLGGYLARLTLWPTKYPDPAIKALSTPGISPL